MTVESSAAVVASSFAFELWRSLAKHLNLYSTGNQMGDVEVHVREGKPTLLPNPVPSPKIVSLVKLTAEREQEAEAMQNLK